MTAGAAIDGPQQLPPGLVHVRLWAIGWTAAAAGALVVFFAIGFLVPLFGSLHQLARPWPGTSARSTASNTR